MSDETPRDVIRATGFVFHHGPHLFALFIAWSFIYVLSYVLQTVHGKEQFGEEA